MHLTRAQKLTGSQKITEKYKKWEAKLRNTADWVWLHIHEGSSGEKQLYKRKGFMEQMGFKQEVKGRKRMEK